LDLVNRVDTILQPEPLQLLADVSQKKDTGDMNEVTPESFRKNVNLAKWRAQAIEFLNYKDAVLERLAVLRRVVDAAAVYRPATTTGEPRDLDWTIRAVYLAQGADVATLEALLMDMSPSHVRASLSHALRASARCSAAFCLCDVHGMLMRSRTLCYCDCRSATVWQWRTCTRGSAPASPRVDSGSLRWQTRCARAQACRSKSLCCS
jgi:hypothetical protein